MITINDKFAFSFKLCDTWHLKSKPFSFPLWMLVFFCIMYKLFPRIHWMNLCKETKNKRRWKGVFCNDHWNRWYLDFGWLGQCQHYRHAHICVRWNIKIPEIQKLCSKVYPYTKEAIRIFRELEYTSANMSKKRKEEKIKELDEQLTKEFEEPLKKIWPSYKGRSWSKW